MTPPSIERTLDVGIPGISAVVSPEALIVGSQTPMTALSSAVVGGGLSQARWIVNMKVPHGYRADPVADLGAFAWQRGIGGPFIGMMTAVPMDRAQAAFTSYHPLTVAAVVTAGTGNAAAPGLTPPGPRPSGTVNVVLLVDACLAPAAMVNLATLAAEVKAHLFLERGVLTAEGHPATGTSTDALVLACTGRGPPLPYGGPATTVGWLAGRCLRQALQAALDAAPETAAQEARL